MLTPRDILFAPVHVQQTVTTGDSSRNLSTSLRLVAYGFIALDTQLASIDIKIGSVSGSPVANIYLVPGTLSTSQDSPIGAPITSALASSLNVSLSVGINTISFGSHTLVVGEKYWIVAQYVSGTSAGFNYLNGAIFNHTISGNGRITQFSFLKLESATSAEPVTWGNPMAINPLSSLRQIYTSGKTFGFLGANGPDAPSTIRHRAETSGEIKALGQAYTIPKGMRLNLKGFLLGLRPSVATATDVEFYADCYVNRSKIASSLSQYSKDLYGTGVAFLSFEFAPTLKIPENCELLILVFCKYHADAYYYYGMRLQLLDNHADDYMPQPLRRAAYYVNDGTGITVNQSAVTSCGLLLDPDEPFYPEPINRRTSTGR